ncbi:uncharacterized protein LOC113343489 [Papaver somniferum]|uniref:uncharacterized protein LOC113343489 n=1 Tax=Papaver somniferum TaxID=3469 RepID=UPI000E6F6FAC|nr:uncharacterized protein LOC113343489 [Papaver somniferum]
MHTTHNTIHAIITSHNHKPDILLTCLYGDNNSAQNQVQWQYLLDMSHDVNIPWVIIGDLNFTMVDSETNSNRPSTNYHSRNIRDIVNQLGLIDLGFHGSNYTWSNHRARDNHTSVRLYMALVNSLWITSYTMAHLQHIAPLASDHNPILLHSIPDSSRSSPFKLYKCWFQVPSCSTTIHNSWNHSFQGSPSYQFSCKLKFTRTELQK